MKLPIIENSTLIPFIEEVTKSAVLGNISTESNENITEVTTKKVSLTKIINYSPSLAEAKTLHLIYVLVALLLSLAFICLTFIIFRWYAYLNDPPESVVNDSITIDESVTTSRRQSRMSRQSRRSSRASNSSKLQGSVKVRSYILEGWSIDTLRKF